MPLPLTEANRVANVSARAARALVVAQYSADTARAWLAAHYGANDAAIACVARAGDVLTTGSIEPPDETGRLIAEAVLRRSVIGKIEGVAEFTRTEFNEPIMRASDTAVGFWVAENTIIPPLDGIDPLTVTRLPVTKIAALVVFAVEFMRRVGPATDSTIRRCVESSLVRRLDASLFDGQPGDASRPPSLIDSTIPGTGNAAEDVGTALSTLPEEYGDSLVLVISPWSVPALLASGAADASTLNGRTGGLLLGWPAVVSTAIPPGAIAWIIPSLIQLANYGVSIGTSEEAIVTVDSGDGPEPHSCWQENLSTVRGVFYVGWRKLEPAAAGMIVDAIPATIRPLASQSKRAAT